MHSTTESDYEAANQWLNSIGDHEEPDEDPSESTVASSPSESLGAPERRRSSDRNSRIMHASSVSKRAAPQRFSKVKREIGPDEQVYRSGCRGVSWNRRMQAWLAFWMDGATRRSKTFSSKTHGFEDARLLAIDFIKQKRSSSGSTEQLITNIPVVETSRRLQRC